MSNRKTTLSADEVESTFTNRKTFSTNEVAQRLRASRQSAIAACAVLRARKLTENAGLATDGSTLWRWV